MTPLFVQILKISTIPPKCLEESKYYLEIFLDLRMKLEIILAVYVKMLKLYFSSKLDWGYYTVSIAKNIIKNIGALIFSMKLLSLGCVGQNTGTNTEDHCSYACYLS